MHPVKKQGIPAPKGKTDIGVYQGAEVASPQHPGKREMGGSKGMGVGQSWII